MKEFRERRRLKRIFLSRPVFALLLCLFILLLPSFFRIYKKSRHADLKNQIVEKELQDLEERKETLGANVNRLRTDTGIEEELRKKFQVKKPGEEFIVILEDTSEPIEESETKKESIFKKFLNLFKRD